LQQRLAIRPLGGRIAQHFSLENEGVEIFTQLLHELALHVRLAFWKCRPDFSRVLAVGRNLKNGLFSTPVKAIKNCDDPDDGFGGLVVSDAASQKRLNFKLGENGRNCGWRMKARGYASSTAER
jgi:hypothetical protein